MTSFTVKLNSSAPNIIVKPQFNSTTTQINPVTIKNQSIKVTGGVDAVKSSNMIVAPSTNTSGIIVRPSFEVTTNPATTITIKNQVLTVSSNSAGPNRLDHLYDVVEGPMPANGSTLVYDPNNDKYVVQRLDFTDVDGPLDGGTF